MTLIGHILGVFYHPKEEWRDIREENYSVRQCFTSHVAYLAAIPPLAVFIGTTQFGFGITSEITFKLTVASALPIAIAFYFALMAGVGLMAWAVHWMERTYGSTSSWEDCMVLTTFTATPMFVAGLAGLIPILWVDVLIGVAAVTYSIFLLYTGVPIMMKINEERAFLFSTAIVTVGLVVLVGILATSAAMWGTIMSPVLVK